MEDSGIDSDPKVPAATTETNSNLCEVDLDTSESASGNEDTNQYDKQSQLPKKSKQPVNQSLLPIQRLSIPAKAQNAVSERLRLVDFESGSDSEMDVHFFPITKQAKSSSKLRTDTFSIEEFPMSDDEEDDLNLMPPRPFQERYTCCAYPIHIRCAIM